MDARTGRDPLDEPRSARPDDAGPEGLEGEDAAGSDGDAGPMPGTGLGPAPGTGSAPGAAAGRARDLDWESALPARLVARDEGVLAEVYDRYSGLMFGLAERACGPQGAEEVVLDTLMKLWRGELRFDPARGALAALLAVTARHAALDRARRARPSLPLEDEAGQPLPLPSPAAGPLEVAEAAWLGETVRRALDRLSGAHRATVERAYFLGQSREEIAAEMRVPVGTVKSRLKYALDALRASLEDLR